MRRDAPGSLLANDPSSGHRRHRTARDYGNTRITQSTKL